MGTGNRTFTIGANAFLNNTESVVGLVGASLLLYYIAAQYTGELARGGSPPFEPPPLLAQPDAETEENANAAGPDDYPTGHCADPG